MLNWLSERGKPPRQAGTAQPAMLPPRTPPPPKAPPRDLSPVRPWAQANFYDRLGDDDNKRDEDGKSDEDGGGDHDYLRSVASLRHVQRAYRATVRPVAYPAAPQQHFGVLHGGGSLGKTMCAMKQRGFWRTPDADGQGQLSIHTCTRRI